MSVKLHFPASDFVLGSDLDSDEVTDWNISADYIELLAYFSKDSVALFTELINAIEIPTEQDREGIGSEVSHREEILIETREVIRRRADLLEDVYPFSMGGGEDSLTYTGNSIKDLSMPQVFGQTAYMISLVLSNHPKLRQVLDVSKVRMNKKEITKIRRYFQYFATAALAGEVSGSAWSFGFPRPGGTGFRDALRNIWKTLKDGEVNPNLGAPKRAKDDKVDVFAARMHKDGYPGFLLAVGQVATGKNWRSKSILGYVVQGGGFKTKWFLPPPVTNFICYHIVPFTFADFTVAKRFEFSNDCAEFGNILHRLRIPRRVKEACIRREEEGICIQAFDELYKAVDWVVKYRKRGQGKNKS